MLPENVNWNAVLQSITDTWLPLIGMVAAIILVTIKYSLQGTTQGRYLTGGVPPVRFSM